MGQKLTGRDVKPNTVVSVTKEEGTTFKGILKSNGKEVKLKRGKGFVYEFAVINTDMQTQIKDKSGKYVDVGVDENEIVSLFAPTMLVGALSHASIGDTITIKYLGKASGKNGDYHNFDVEKE